MAPRAVLPRDLSEAFALGGRVGRHMADLDWARTPFGPVDMWSPSLRGAVRAMLASQEPQVIFWGPQFAVLWNEVSLPVIGDLFPGSFALPAEQAFPDAWEASGHNVRATVERGVPVAVDDLQIIFNRHGYPEETYHRVVHTPIFGDSGRGEGCWVVYTEVTRRVLAGRRIRALQSLAASTAGSEDRVEVCARAAAALGDDPSDLPYVLLFLAQGDGEGVRLAGSAGLREGELGFLEALPIEVAEQTYGLPLREAELTRSAQVTQGFERHLPLDETSGRPHSGSALVLPVATSGEEAVAGFLVAGTSALIPLDHDYVAFAELVANELMAELVKVGAMEQQRRRADALEQLNHAKTAFFSNVSHEFRTPLTLLLGPLQDALAESRAAPAQTGRIELAHRNALRLQRLVDALLDFSRLESDRVRPAFAPVDLARLTSELASAFESAVGHAGLRLVIDCPPLPQPVYVDARLWERVVFNLVGNAFKFTREGEVRVTTRSAGVHAEVAVSDTGVGIPADQVPHLFERFHQVPGGWARSHEGFGIGLALVKEIVELHGGTVTADSAEGCGTTFLVTVPLGAAHLPAELVHAEPPAPVALEAHAGAAAPWPPEVEAEAQATVDGAAASRRRGGRGPAKGRILVVDDNADMRGYLRGLLEEHWDVDLLADGTTALQRIHRTKPDVVLADVMMPGLDGLELVRRLRGDPGTANLPILLLSARAGHEAAVEGLLAGADDYLAKPFSAPELIARIRSRLELLRARRRETTLAKAMLAITQGILAGEDVDRVLGQLARHASVLLEADGASVARPSSGAGEELTIQAAVGIARGLAAHRLPVSASLHGSVFRSGRGRLVAEVDGSDGAYRPALRGTQRLGPGLFVPLAAGDRTIGALGVVRRRGRPPFTNTDRRLLRILAGQAALAIEHAERVALLERQRLARNLHDSVSQSIYGVALGARTALRRFETDPGRAVEPLEYVLELAESALAEMRTLIFELRPESLREHGLVVAIERQLEAARIRHHLAVDADLPAEPDLPLGLKEALYRVAQEALQNVVKHAQATRVQVRLRGGDHVELEVTDDGVGLGEAGDGEVPGHYGLRGMRERVQQRGGALSVSSATGGGTTVRASIPL